MNHNHPIVVRLKDKISFSKCNTVPGNVIVADVLRTIALKGSEIRKL